MTEILGYCLMAIPFLIVFAITVKFTGWKGLLIVLVSVGLIIACIFGGVYLVKGGLQ